MCAAQPIVHVIDDDPALRHSLTWLIGSIGLQVLTYPDPHVFLDRYDPASPGCIVVDLRMPGMSGLDLQETLRARHSALPLIFISGHGEISAAVRAMRNGAVDFLEKPFSDQVLLDRIQQAIELNERLRRAAEADTAILARYRGLTERERQVFDMVVSGASNKRIAQRLDIATKTVETHRARVMLKMQAQSVAELVSLHLHVESHQGKP